MARGTITPCSAPLMFMRSRNGGGTVYLGLHFEKLTLLTYREKWTHFILAKN
jgi:hypothetical protein